MSNDQRVQYLHAIFSKRQDMTPELLLLHVRGHLPESEKQDFTTLSNSILTPKTNDEMQQLAQMELLGDEFPQPQSQNALEMRNPTKAAKKPSKKELARNPNATTLWPDLMQEQSNSKPAKERRGRKANNVENHLQEGQSSNSMSVHFHHPSKGTVVDAIVGAFLTQNVNDVLSSSAFMAMRSHFRNDLESHLQ